ncbi:hypothetical protein B188_08080 [Candidatus Brocadiaceae bacterium B188]|nr:hypothetical protein [Candidatus Brocadia sapporoensis]QQR67985.1 MAG: hypothetical protein IPI25_07350 [Candidatus Brocadia sp.]RZV58091.1 MAG: hypothetical protein EX330_07495 [Candidatus Brocadia sp. BROELEC01]TWU52847.1 hypothetical protein B188_08080 [Candidatus Brocadiaceae bacterium B188]
MKSTAEEAKKKSQKKKATGKKENGIGRKSVKAGKAGSDKLPFGELLGHTGQISSIVTNGLDLAEASIRLGINLVNKFGAVVQGQVIDKMASTVFQGAASFQQKPEEAGTQATDYQYSDEAGTPQSPNTHRSLFIVNRLPLFPGSPVHITFSINNDSASASKGIRLELEDFIGATSGFKLLSGVFEIKPSQIVIAPMDFEKFILAGMVPSEAPPDSYNSWIKVSGVEEIKIPVILAVSIPV